MSEEISIVYASDENFLPQTYVSMYSVLANRQDNYFIKFYICVPESCNICRYDQIWNYNQYSIEYIYISNQYFQVVDMKIQHITKPTYYRLLLPLLLSGDKCIYLDGDTICCDDIYKLYNVELGDNLIAAVKGAMLWFDAGYLEEILDVPNAENYINAGVLVMNLKLMRQCNLVERFIEFSQKGYPCQDQDVLNKCCYSKIRLLPLQYNVYANVFIEPQELLMQRFSISEIEDAITKPVIIHYPREYSKPWKNLRCVKGQMWWGYAKKVLDRETFLRIQQDAKEWENRYSYKRLFDKVEKCKQLVLFGFSEIGKMLCDEIDSKFPCKIAAFCDNAKEKQGTSYKGYSVITIDKLLEKYKQDLIVITSQNYSDIIYKQLLELGFKSDNIIIYRKKILDYVYSVDKEYWSEMWEDITEDTISTKECLESGIREVEEYILG